MRRGSGTRIGSRLWVALLAVVLALGIVAAGCGGDGGDDGDDGGDQASTTENASPAQGREGAQGGEVPSDKTIGFLNIQGQAPAAQRLQAEFEAGAKEWGWTVNATDAQGDPAKMASGAQAFVNQNVDALVTISVPPAAAQQAFQQAKEKGIPVFTVGGPAPPNDVYQAEYAPNDAELAAILTQYLIDDLGNSGEIVAHFDQSLPALARRETVIRAMLEKTDIKIAQTAQVDLANPVESTVQSTLDMLRGNPDAKGVLLVHDFQFTPVVEALRNNDQFSDVKVYGFYAGGDTLQALRGGLPARAVADAPVAASSWVGVDALVRYFTNDTPITQQALYDKPFPMTLITSDNIATNVPEGADVYPFPDYGDIFREQWEQEGFTKSGG